MTTNTIEQYKVFYTDVLGLRYETVFNSKEEADAHAKIVTESGYTVTKIKALSQLNHNYDC